MQLIPVSNWQATDTITYSIDPGASHWFITEWGHGDIMFGYACLEGDWMLSKLGSISLKDLFTVPYINLNFS